VPRLLVSVRSVSEAILAEASGVDLIDVKEPTRGSLGAADGEVVGQIVGQLAGRRPVSVALGELECTARETHPAAGSPLGQLLQPGVSYAKLGLAGCARVPDWVERWRMALAEFPVEVAPVAVVYADWDAAAAPSPHEVLATGAGLGCRALLIDTFDKSAGSLLDHWPLAQLRDFLAEVRRRSMLAVLAGSLSPSTIPQVLPLAPDYIAVRGAACQGGREGTLDASRMRELTKMVRGGMGHSRPVGSVE
jgi:uncharacterized protein (UPF0264 family)